MSRCRLWHHPTAEIEDYVPGITQRDRGAFVTGAFVAAVSFKLTSISFWNTLDSTHNASDMFCFVFVN